MVPIRRTSAALDGFFTLNETAADIWAWIGKGRSLDEMATQLAAEYEIELADARNDVSNIVNELVAVGALVSATDEE